MPSALGIFTAEEALSVLTQLLGRTRFEPATGDPAVTLTASLADPIVRYDGIWVSGLHAGAIPERARFDPFIPVALQRQAGFHAADAAALVDQAQQAVWRRCAAAVVSSLSARPRMPQDLELTALAAAGTVCGPLVCAAPRRRRVVAGHSRSAAGRAICRRTWGSLAGGTAIAGRHAGDRTAESLPVPCLRATAPRRPAPGGPHAGHHASRARAHAASGPGAAVAPAGRFTGLGRRARRSIAVAVDCRERRRRPPAKYCRERTLTQWMRPIHRPRMPRDWWRCGVPPSAASWHGRGG